MIGKTISNYKILEELAAGAMGVVYKAKETKLQHGMFLKFQTLKRLCNLVNRY